MAQKQPESHYNIDKLHMIFAILAIILVVGLGGLIFKDYSRKWKDYQRDFRTMEIDKTRIRADIIDADLQNNPEFTELVAKIDEAKKDYAAKCNNFEQQKNEITSLNTEKTLLNQQAQGVNTALGVSKFQLESSQAHHPAEVDVKKAEYEKLKTQAASFKEKIAQLTESIEGKEKTIAQCSTALDDLERQKRRFTADLELTKRKLKNIDPAQMSFINQLAAMIRDLPVLDLSTPNQRIEQVVLKDITDDLTFTKVPKIERCITCHQGIANAAYKDAPQPFRAHPNLELFLGNKSAHPLEEFGCTVCHGGRGRGTDFTSAVHTPATEEQEKEWVKKYNWKEMHHWEDPMLAKPYFEAGCFKCHDNGMIKGAEKLNLGLHLIEKAGCYNCHLIDRYKDWPKSGPGLDKVASKLSKDFIYRWIENPQSFRHNTWMPRYFGQSNNEDPASHQRGEQEVLAITNFLYAKSKQHELTPLQLTGDSKNGAEIVASIGCFACHKVQPEPSKDKTTRTDLFREYGPNLIGLGSKVTKEWLYDWLKDPKRYHPETRMPDLRLSDQDAADVTEYLIQNHNPQFDAKEIPPVDEPVLNTIVGDFIKGTMTDEEAQQKVAGMSVDEKQMFAGEKLIGTYGCYSCHDIDGFQNRKPIGIELTFEGDKPLGKLDFGFVHVKHAKSAWFSQKLKDPRFFDEHKVLSFEEKLKMPNFYLKDDEIEAMVTAILGFTEDATVKNKKPKVDAIVRAGEEVVKQFNCQACHIIEGDGGHVRASVSDWLVKHEGVSEADAAKTHESYSPPNLFGTGKKLDPKWLFDFLHQPGNSTVRPWLKIKMPTYKFNASHLNMLVKYFNALDEEEFPFHEGVDTSLNENEYLAAEKMFSKEVFGCNLCHVVGNQTPTGSAESWAPDLVLAKTRLQPGWVINWLKNPSAIQPGTKMPAFWDPADFENAGPPDILNGDENEQIRVMRNYLMSFADRTPNLHNDDAPAPAKAAPETTPVAEPAEPAAPAEK